MGKARSSIERPALLFLSVLLVWIAGEVLSLPLLYVLTGRWYPRSELRATLNEKPSPERLPAAGEQGPGYMTEHVLHPYVGFVRNPELVHHVFNDRVVTKEVNRYGFFGPSPMDDGGEDAYWIALTGGSAALDLFLRKGDLLEDELRRLPGLPVEKARLFSLALGGFKQPQQLLALNLFLALGAPIGMVINLDGFNEIALPLAENAPSGVTPLFPRNWKAYAMKGSNPAVAATINEIFRIRESTEKWRGFFSHFPLDRSNLGLTLWHLKWSRNNTKRLRLEERIRTEMAADGPLSYQQRGPSYQPESDEQVLVHSADLWMRASERMARLCDAEGIDYFHFLQPNQHLPGSKRLTDWEKRFAVAGPQYPHVQAVAEGYPLLIERGERLAREGVSFFDLTGLFRDVEETAYSDACCHYNDRGNEILARAIAAKIGERGLESATPGRE